MNEINAISRKLPIYDAIIDLNDDSSDNGVFAISLVDSPAVQTEWIAFNKQNPQLAFSIDDEPKHIVSGVIMLADTPIYRNSPNIGEYYIRFSKESIRKFSEQMFKNDAQENIDIDHNGHYLKKGDVQLIECFIKDVENGINPSGFNDVADGSLFGSFKVNNPDVWDLIVNHKINGFSIMGQFDLGKTNEFIKLSKNKTYCMYSVKNILKKILQSFNEVALKDGNTIVFDGENLEVGVEVIDTADGEYTLEDGTIVVVKEGKVDSITEPETTAEPETQADVVEADEDEPTTAESTAEPTTESESEPEPSEIDKLKEAIANLVARIEALESKVTEFIATPATPPVMEEFKNVTANADPKNIKLQRMLKYANAIKH